MTRDSAIVCQYDAWHHQKIVTHTHTHKPHSFIPSCIHHSSSSPQQKRRTFEKCITIDSLCGHRYQSFRSLVALLFIHFRSIFSKTSQCDILAHDLLALFPPQKMCFEIFTTLLFLLKMMIIGGIFKRHPDRNSGSGTFQK